MELLIIIWGTASVIIGLVCYISTGELKYLLCVIALILSFGYHLKEQKELADHCKDLEGRSCDPDKAEK